MGEFPLYPSLSEEGMKEASALIESFKVALTKAADEAISKLYTDIVFYIESDSWTNFRNQLMDGLRNYGNRKIQGQYDFAKIRKAIFEEFKAEIIPELNQDILEENESLKKQIEWFHESRK